MTPTTPVGRFQRAWDVAYLAMIIGAFPFYYSRIACPDGGSLAELAAAAPPKWCTTPSAWWHSGSLAAFAKALVVPLSLQELPFTANFYMTAVLGVVALALPRQTWLRCARGRARLLLVRASCRRREGSLPTPRPRS